MLIRVATPSDAIPLAELKRDTFRETFLQDGFNIDYPPHDLAAYETQAYSVETVTGQLNDPQCRTWVAESDDGRLVGYAHAGRASSRTRRLRTVRGNPSDLPSARHARNRRRARVVRFRT